MIVHLNLDNLLYHQDIMNFLTLNIQEKAVSLVAHVDHLTWVPLDC